MKSTDGTVIEKKMERNLFGKLLCVALEMEIDRKEILRYPLTPLTSNGESNSPDVISGPQQTP